MSAAAKANAALMAASEPDRLANARPSERFIVECLRRWLDGPIGQAGLWNDLARKMGPGRARPLLKAFEGYLDALARGRRRELTRHATACPCLGEDEAIVAGIVCDATKGDRERAWTRAAAIAREADLILIMERAVLLGSMMDDLCGGPVSGDDARARLH